MKRFKIFEEYKLFPNELNQINWKIVKKYEKYKNLNLLGFTEFHTKGISNHHAPDHNLSVFTLSKGDVNGLPEFKFAHLANEQYLVKINIVLNGDIRIKTCINSEDSFDHVSPTLNDRYSNIWTTELYVEAIDAIYNYLPEIIKILNSWNCKLKTSKIDELDNIQIDNLTSDQINNLW